MQGHSPSIAITGMACVYPDARTPQELWENVMAQRQAFRRLPAERMRSEDYWSADRTAPDRTYSDQAAVIEGYEFDRLAYRVVGSTFRSADHAHWLALDVAARALTDAAFPEGRGLPRDTTGVLLGNTLTGEFSRANTLRLRWPYVRRVLESALSREGWDAGTRQDFLQQLEEDYKAPFPAVGEETLAGGLSNTIAGRICNQFDLHGGGYTLDAACASSLLAVANACSALAAGDLDVALAGGVDLSLDPFELVGFAKTSALAVEEMRVFDRRSAGFWPGEGCGFVVLMRQEDALARGARIYALIRGWGISSDGNGGITRPEAQGQLEALRRAYRRAGFSSDTVVYCEGHGTGTAVGDATELEVLSRARREANPSAPPAVIGSIKANIGHTKAAAGVAGLLKAAMALQAQVLPPTTGCSQPHALCGPSANLRVLREPEPWPQDRPLRAAVSAMGFGGINVHLVLDGEAARRREGLTPRERAFARSLQDCELFLLAAPDVGALAEQASQLLALAPKLARAELTDLAAHLQKSSGSGAVRAAIVASSATELTERLQILRSWLAEGVTRRCGTTEGIFLGDQPTPPRIGFLFPGQGSPTQRDGGAWVRRFNSVRELYAVESSAEDEDPVSTRVMQPAVVKASLAGLKVLHEFGLNADSALGHSLGELTALHWGGAICEATLLHIAKVRGAAMADLGSATGAMAAVAAPAQTIQGLEGSETVSIVGFNSPRQTVVAGEAEAVHRFAQLANADGYPATLLNVSHAFHTPLVAAAIPVLAEHLRREDFSTIHREVFSTVTGEMLQPADDLRELLCRQVTSPVLFESGLRLLTQTPFDLLIEVGPGSVLTGLARDSVDVTCLSVDAGGESFAGLLGVLGAAFVLGAPVRTSALFADRFTRTFDPDRKPKFFSSPCELFADSSTNLRIETESVVDRRVIALSQERTNGRQGGSFKSHHNESKPPTHPNGSESTNGQPCHLDPLSLVRQLVAERAELPIGAILNSSRLLSDLHLNSITVGQLASEAARRLSLPSLVAATDFANATVSELAQALNEIKRTGVPSRANDKPRHPAGVDSWFRPFALELIGVPRAANRRNGSSRPTEDTSPEWQIFGPLDHPLRESLQARLKSVHGGGVLLCLPESPDENDLGLFLPAAQAVMAVREHPHFVVVQHGWGGGGFARTLHLETPGLTTCILNVPAGHPKAVDWIASELGCATGFVEVHFDRQGRRFEPRLTAMGERPRPAEKRSGKSLGKRLASTAVAALGRDDLLLVTGGGKGIAAECALALGRATGARLLLMGRSDPAQDDELAQNLARISEAGVTCSYLSADVTDSEAVRRVLTRSQEKLGPVTALLHGAGVNTPQLIAGLDESALRRTLAPKLGGLRNVLAALAPERLRLLVAFGSIIARTGLPGEADYALANEWLTAFVDDFQRRHAKCRCLSVEWSVWSGAGMGQRLGRIETLSNQGIAAIPPEEGERMLLELILQSKTATPGARTNGASKPGLSPTAVVVTGRFGEPPTLRLKESELPMWRFLELKRVYYPGVELLTDCRLSALTDPYLNDHALQKQRLFPAVLGLEAMAQAAMALTGSTVPPAFERVELARPIAVPEKGPATIRLAALRRGPALVEVCIRCEETDFLVDHFRAFCRFRSQSSAELATDTGRVPPPSEQVGLQPEKELYGPLLFHENRFRRVGGYRLLEAKACVAEITPDRPVSWFGPYLPARFVLGDPGARDAVLHAIQACIPHRLILPTGIDRLCIQRIETGVRFVRATERERHGNDFVYDLLVTNNAGELVETWHGLRLRAVEPFAASQTWPAPLLSPYLGRRLEELVSEAAVNVAFKRNGSGRNSTQRKRSPNTALRSLGAENAFIRRRPDGKPLITDGHVSLSHVEGFVLTLTGAEAVGCDAEPVAARAQPDWLDLLGELRLKLAERLARERGETLDASATRVWTLLESLKKAGAAHDAPIVLDSVLQDGWVLLRSGSLMLASFVTKIQGLDSPVALAFAVATNQSARLRNGRQDTAGIPPRVANEGAIFSAAAP